MKLFICLLLGLMAMRGYAQTNLRAVMADASGNVFYTNTNTLTFTSPLAFGASAAATRSNLSLGAAWLTNTNAPDFRAAIGLGWSSLTNTNAASFRAALFGSGTNAVLVNSNGEVVSPTNVWAANSNAINAVIAPVSYFTERIFNRRMTSFADLRTESVDASANVSNSTASITIQFTNTNGAAAVMLMRDINNVGPAGVGTRFGADNHWLWINFDCVVREHGTFRVVLGGNQNATSNIGAYPTNSAFGFELTQAAGETNQVRLIAHNGTTNTNGPWVPIGNLFQRYWIGVEQNKTNGEVKLYVGVNAATPTNNTNATISGGPTNNAAAANTALTARVSITNSNTNGNVGVSILSAFVDVID
jgi:hypothetical protein